jgi:hypothetical protein
LGLRLRTPFFGQTLRPFFLASGYGRFYRPGGVVGDPGDDRCGACLVTQQSPAGSAQPGQSGPAAPGREHNVRMSAKLKCC